MNTGEIPPGTKPLPCDAWPPLRASFIMSRFLKLQLARIRWGRELTENDILFLDGLTLSQVVKSSYLLPKSLELRTSKRHRRW